MLEKLKEQKKILEKEAENERNSLNSAVDQETYYQYAFVTHDDLSKLCSLEESKQNKILIVEANPGTTINMPASQNSSTMEGNSHEHIISLQTDNYPIMVYTVDNEEISKDLI